MGRLTGERKAIAAAVLALYSLLFVVVAMNPPPGWQACFTALAGVYGLAFFGLVAGYFWSRWYAVGLGMSGLISAAISIWQIGMEPVLVFYGATHAAVSALLWGKAMASSFDGKLDWRQRFHLDESSTNRLGKAVIRLGISLPYVVMYGLAPRDGAGSTLLALGGVLLAGFGTWALFSMRTWGVVALAASAVALLASAAGTPQMVSMTGGYGIAMGVTGLAAITMLVAAIAPFARPITRHLLEDGQQQR
jgi:hypothetical protein